MKHVFLIVSREYLSRIRRKSFLIMTLLAPVLFATLIFVSAWSASGGIDETKKLLVKDESGWFIEVFSDDSFAEYTFYYGDLEQGKQLMLEGRYDGLLHIPALDLNSPNGIELYTPNNPGFAMVQMLDRMIESELEEVKLKNIGISKALLDGLKANIDIATINLEGAEENRGNAIAASAVGYICGFLIYMFIFVYGAMCMRGVVQEKTNRIIEVLIASVKPFYLMMGKVIGIAAVGLTQFLLWVVLSFGAITIVGLVMAGDNSTVVVASGSGNLPINTLDQNVVQSTSGFSEFQSAIESVNFPLLFVCFVFFFLAGYLLYGALFASIGAAVDSDTDAQQFMLPVTIPLIVSIMLLNAVVQDPNSTLAFWLSICPLTAPIIMMMRIPFGVDLWELLLSMTLMVLGFLGAIWMASKIYRIGILIHGSKVNYRILWKWLTQAN